MESKTDYFECELDPDEFKKDPNAVHSPGFRFADLPFYLCNVFLALLYCFVTPLTLHDAWRRIKKSHKRVRRQLRHRVRNVRKYGLFGTPQRRPSAYKNSAHFITDKMLSSSEEEEAGSDKKRGVFTA